MGEKHVWEGKTSILGTMIVDHDGKTHRLSKIMNAIGGGKRVRITVEVLENGGGDTEEASRREV